MCHNFRMEGDTNVKFCAFGALRMLSVFNILKQRSTFKVTRSFHHIAVLLFVCDYSVTARHFMVMVYIV